MIKTILVPLPGDGADEAVLDLGYLVAQQFGAHIDALHTRRNPVEEAVRMTASDGIITKQLWDAVEGDIEIRRDKAKDCFTRFCKSRALPTPEAPRKATSPSARWIEVEGDFASEIRTRGRFHEVIVTSRGHNEGGFTPGELGDMLIRSGRPFLLTSRKAKLRPLFGTVAIAWKDSAEAAHMMTAAMPFIKAAEKVVVLAASEGSDNSVDLNATQRLANALRWHGIEADVHCLTCRDSDVGEALVGAAEKAGAGLLALGGYGHSRAREFVLGGVTRYMLETADFPTLIVH